MCSATNVCNVRKFANIVAWCLHIAGIISNQGNYFVGLQRLNDITDLAADVGHGVPIRACFYRFVKHRLQCCDDEVPNSLAANVAPPISEHGKERRVGESLLYG